MPKYLVQASYTGYAGDFETMEHASRRRARIGELISYQKMGNALRARPTAARAAAAARRRRPGPVESRSGRSPAKSRTPGCGAFGNGEGGVTAQGGDMIDLLTIEEVAERLRTVGQLAGRQAAAGMPDVRVHDLRHTAASLWLAAGADPKVVQPVLGHAIAAMTTDLSGTWWMPACGRQPADRGHHGGI
jgi:Phage integrase family